MKNKFLMAVSAVALMASVPALANDPDRLPAEHTNKTDIERGWDKTKETVSDAAKATGDAVEGAYMDAKRALTGKEAAIGQPVKINTRNTAENLIGQDVRNGAGETVAVVEDIILDRDGEAQLLVLKDGDFFGMGGKKVALNYSGAVRHDANGDVILPVTEKMIDQVAEFSYEPKSSGKNVRLIPQGGVSVARLMDGDVVNDQGKKVADIEDLSFRNGNAEYVVLSFGKVMNMGGEQAVVDFDGLKLVPEPAGKANLGLSAQQSAELETFKKDM